MMSMSIPRMNKPKDHSPIAMAPRSQAAFSSDADPGGVGGKLGGFSLVHGARTALALILEPTRDLAEQTGRVVSDLCRSLGNDPAVRCVTLVGGTSPKDQIKAFQQHPPNDANKDVDDVAMHRLATEDNLLEAETKRKLRKPPMQEWYARYSGTATQPPR